MNRRLIVSLLSVLACSLLLTSALLAQEKKPPKITYDEHVKPILRQKCASCHNPDKKSGDLDVTNYTNLMQGGGSGTVIEPGDSSGSYLYALITHADEPFMPPESPKIADAMIETIRKWIDGGVLENASSKAAVSKKPKFDLALSDAPTERPANPAMPAHLSLEPVVHTNAGTAVSAMATSPWAPLAAIAGQKQVLLYNTQTLEMLAALPFPEGTPEVLKFSRNGSLLLAGGGRGGANGLCVVWNVKSGERVFQVGDELDAVLAADISSDQTLIALGGPQRVVRIYSTETGSLLHELRKHTDWIYSLEFSPDSVLLATGDRNGGLFVWEGWTGREYLTLKGHTKSVCGVSWRSDSNLLATGSEDGTIKLWEMENGGQVRSWNAHGGGVASIEFARDGRILSCGRDRVAKLWKQDGGQIRAFEAFSDLALEATFCDETDRAIAGDWKGEVRVWKAADGARLGGLSQNPPPLAQRLASAKQQLAAAQAAHKPLADAYNAAQAAAVKAKTDLDAAQKAAVAAKQLADTSTAAAAAEKQKLDAANKVNQDAAAAVAALQKGMAELQDAVTKAEAAAAKLPEDKVLAEAAATLKKNLADRVAQLAVNQKKAAEATKVATAAKAAYDGAQKKATDSAAVLKAATAKVAALTPLVAPAQKKATDAKPPADAAAAKVKAFQDAVNRWNGEIAFVSQLNQLSAQVEQAIAKLTEHQTKEGELVAALQTAQAALAQAKANMAKAQAEVAALQKQVAAYDATVKAANEAMVKAVAEHQSAGKLVTTTQAVIASLTEASAKAQDAAQKSGNEAAIVELANKAKGLVAAKTAQLAAAQKAVLEKAKAVETAKTQLAAKQKQATDTKTALTAAQQRLTAATAAVKPVEAKVAPAKAAADAASAASSVAQQQVDAAKAKVDGLKGL